VCGVEDGRRGLLIGGQGRRRQAVPWSGRLKEKQICGAHMEGRGGGGNSVFFAAT
jgi:hypothetical protein